MGFDINKTRDWVNKNSAAVTIGAIVILIFALAYIWLQNKGPSYSGAAMDMWFYDVNADKLFIDKGDKYPPIDAPSGGKAFKAYIFTCGSCANESERFAGYYEGFTDEFKEMMQKAQEAAKNGNQAVMPEAAMYMEEGYAKGRLISKDGKEWVESNSVEGIAITTELSKACEKRGGGQLKPCYPGMK